LCFNLHFQIWVDRDQRVNNSKCDIPVLEFHRVFSFICSKNWSKKDYLDPRSTFSAVSQDETGV
jgi:hypothetical protein